jgi:hypothetical protein
LYEVGLAKQHVHKFPNGPQFQRLEALYACLEAIKAFFDIYLSVPVIQYFSFTMPAWSHITSCMIVLQLLSTFNYPGWNLNYVRETLDFKDIINRLVEKFEMVRSEPGCEDTVVFTRISHKLQSIQSYIEAKASDPSIIPGPEITSRGFRDPLITNGGDFTDFFDEVWLRDILEPWDSQPNMSMI